MIKVKAQIEFDIMNEDRYEFMCANDRTIKASIIDGLNPHGNVRNIKVNNLQVDRDVNTQSSVLTDKELKEKFERQGGL